jgi:cytochrome c-type biogenesis protein CcmH/NrfF
VDVTWFAPVVVLILGAAAVAVLVRCLADEAEALSMSQRRFRRIEHALIPVRVETRRTRASIEQIRRR